MSWLRRTWRWWSDADTVISRSDRVIKGLSFVIGGGVPFGLGFLGNVAPIWWGLAVLGGVAIGLRIANEITWRRVQKKNAVVTSPPIEPTDKASNAQPTYIGETFRVADLVAGINPPRIDSIIFENCDLEGPAMIVQEGFTAFIGCTFQGTRETLLLEVEYGRTMIGVVGVKDCIFRNCRFHQIGVVIHPGLREKWLQGLGDSDTGS